MSDKIKCISLWEIWASAMARGFKRNETRSWYTSHRGPLAIHAAKKPFRLDDYDHGFVSFVRSRGLLENLGYGHVLAIVDMVKCVRTEKIARECSLEELEFGDYTPGRFAWVTENLRVLPKPFPLRGQQGLFDWDVPQECIHLLDAKEDELFGQVSHD